MFYINTIALKLLIMFDVNHYTLFAKSYIYIFHLERCTEGRNLQTLAHQKQTRWPLAVVKLTPFEVL